MIEAAKRELAERHIRTFVAAMLRLGYERKEIAALLKQESAEEEKTDVGFGV